MRMKNIFYYFTTLALFNVIALHAGKPFSETEIWEKIITYANQYDIDVYSKDFRKDITQCIMQNEKDLAITFTLLLYIGNLAYLNNDITVFKEIYKELKSRLDNCSADFILSLLPENCKANEEYFLNFYDYINNRGSIIITLQLLSDLNIKGKEEKARINSIRKLLFDQAKQYVQ